LIRTLYPKLIKGVKQAEKGPEEVDNELKEETLDILTEIFKKFGNLLQK